MGLYRVTIAGLYEWDDTLFDKMEFPESADRQNFIDSLLLSYGDCEPLYPDWDFMHENAIPAWSRKWKRSIDKVYKVLDLTEYEPLENYDRHEEWTDSPDMTRTSQSSGQDVNRAEAGQGTTTTNSGSDTAINDVSAFNDSSYSPNEKTTTEYGGSTKVQSSGESKNTFEYGKGETSRETGQNKHSGRIHGNIGVTTSQQMVLSELSLRKQSFIDYCTGIFAQDLLLLIY